MMEDDDPGASFADQAKQVLADAGFEYDRNQRNLWTKGVDGNLHVNAVGQMQICVELQEVPSRGSTKIPDRHWKRLK